MLVCRIEVVSVKFYRNGNLHNIPVCIEGSRCAYPIVSVSCRPSQLDGCVAVDAGRDDIQPHNSVFLQSQL